MKIRHSLFILLLIISPLKLFSQHTLTVEITGLRNNNGNVLYELFDAKHKSLVVDNEIISNNKCVIILKNIKPGKYGFNYIHDENINKKLDTKLLIIPIEGFGNSKNADGTFGLPAFKKWAFDLKENTKLNLKVTYLNY